MFTLTTTLDHYTVARYGRPVYSAEATERRQYALGRAYTAPDTVLQRFWLMQAAVVRDAVPDPSVA
jgi:hypothetical protein